jgi:hypothetical protein
MRKTFSAFSILNWSEEPPRRMDEFGWDEKRKGRRISTGAGVKRTISNDSIDLTFAAFANLHPR